MGVSDADKAEKADSQERENECRLDARKPASIKARNKVKLLSCFDDVSCD